MAEKWDILGGKLTAGMPGQRVKRARRGRMVRTSLGNLMVRTCRE